MSVRLRSVLCLLFYVALAAGLAVSAAGFFGSWHVAFDATNHFRPHLIILSLTALGVAWFIDGRRALTGAVVCLGLNLSAFGAFMPEAAPQNTTPSENRISLATFNVWGRNDDLAGLEDVLRNENSDFVVLQEVSSKKAALLRRLRDLYPYQVHCAQLRGCKLALLSKYPFADAQARSRTVDAPPIIWARFEMPSADHGEPFTLVGTHLYRALPGGPQFEDKDFLVEFVGQLEGHVAMVGDFNATPWSYVLEDLSRQTGLKLVYRFLPTWPAHLVAPQFPIDLMLVSEAFKKQHVRRGVRGGSDHRPVIAELGLPADIVLTGNRPASASAKIADRLSQ